MYLVQNSRASTDPLKTNPHTHGACIFSFCFPSFSGNLRIDATIEEIKVIVYCMLCYILACFCLVSCSVDFPIFYVAPYPIHRHHWLLQGEEEDEEPIELSWGDGPNSSHLHLVLISAVHACGLSSAAENPRANPFLTITTAGRCEPRAP
jgi:hypothetical protein